MSILIPGFIIESATIVRPPIAGQGLKLYGGTSGYSGFKPSANAGSTIWQLPAVDGSSRQVVITDGSGNLSFATLANTDITGFGTLSTLNAAPAGTLTGAALAANVLASSLTSVGTIATGIWNGTPIGSSYGGAGTVNGLMKANGSGVVSLAVAGTDYSTGTSSLTTGILKSTTTTGALTIAVASDLPGFGIASGLATLDSGGKVPSAQLPSSVTGAMNYQGTWNATTNSPTLVSGVGTKGFFYKVATAGSTSIDGINQWNIGDSIVFDGTTWDKIDGIANEVITVAGRFGNVVLSNTDISGLGGLATLSAAPAGTLTGATLAAGVTASSLTSVGTLSTGVWNATAVAPQYGGTGLATLTAHAVMLGEGTSNVGFAAIGTAGRLLIDQGASADPSFTAMSGDATIINTGVITVGKFNGGTVFGSLAGQSGTFSGTSSGTNTGDVTLAGQNYLTIASQVITANAVNLSGTHVTGTLAAGRFPALTSDVTTVAGALATTVAAIQGTAVSGVTGTTNVVFSASPALTGVPTAPTAAVATNTTQIATTAFVIANGGGTLDAVTFMSRYF